MCFNLLFKYVSNAGSSFDLGQNYWFSKQKMTLAGHFSIAAVDWQYYLVAAFFAGAFLAGAAFLTGSFFTATLTAAFFAVEVRALP